MDADTVSAIANVITAIVTTIAVIVGGIWTYLLFIQKRQKYPRAEIIHEIIQKQLPDGKFLLHLTIWVRNIGEVLISLKSGEVRLLQVLPFIEEIKDALSNDQDPVEGKETEVSWYEISSRQFFEKSTINEIEPGEVIDLHADFIVMPDIFTVQVYTYFENIKKRGKKIGWNLTTFHDLRKDEEKMASNTENSSKKIVPSGTKLVVKNTEYDPQVKQQKPKPPSRPIPKPDTNPK